MNPQRRRHSMDEPTEELSDIIHLREELNRLHEEITPECNEHIKKLTEIVNEFEKDYRHAFYDNIRRGAITGMVLGLAFAAFTFGDSAIAAGLGAAVAAAIIFIIERLKKKQQGKKIKTNHRKRT